MDSIRLAIAGIGNCASSLLQGIAYYGTRPSTDTAGLLHAAIGGYRLQDIRTVAAFDIDRRKVGRPLEEAVFAPPNCTEVFHRELPCSGVTVDAIRCAKLALNRNIGGPLHEISAFCMKHPPKQLRDSEARERVDEWIGIQETAAVRIA
jgi:myo-inositol-1-phosphate synthase